MCTADGVPDGAAFGSTAEALRTGAALADYLNFPAGTDLELAAPGAVLAFVGAIQSKLAAARAGFLRRLDAPDAHDADGCASSSSAWLDAPGQEGTA
jgi:hypothetical protein